MSISRGSRARRGRPGACGVGRGRGDMLRLWAVAGEEGADRWSPPVSESGRREAEAGWCWAVSAVRAVGKRWPGPINPFFFIPILFFSLFYFLIYFISFVLLIQMTSNQFL